MQFSLALKRTMYNFKNCFFPNYLLIHRAEYIFSRYMLCLYHFRAKIHGVSCLKKKLCFCLQQLHNDLLLMFDIWNIFFYSDKVCIFEHVSAIAAFISITDSMISLFLCSIWCKMFSKLRLRPRIRQNWAITGRSKEKFTISLKISIVLLGNYSFVFPKE